MVLHRPDSRIDKDIEHVDDHVNDDEGDGNDEDDTLDLSDLGDDFFEIECPSCGEDIVIDESVLDIGEVTCPNCGDRFSMDLVEEPETDDGADDPQ